MLSFCAGIPDGKLDGVNEDVAVEEDVVDEIDPEKEAIEKYEKVLNQQVEVITIKQLLKKVLVMNYFY